MNLLAERELIRPVATRVVSGIIETSYRIAQLGVKLDRGLLAGDSPALHDMLTTVFDGARDDIERGIRAGAIDLGEETDPLRRVILAKGLTRLSPERAAEFQARLKALLESYDDDAKAIGRGRLRLRPGLLPDDRHPGRRRSVARGPRR